MMNYNDLKENINNFSINELKEMLLEYNDGFIYEQRLECIKLIIKELEYRRLYEYVKESIDLKVLVNYNYDILWKIDNDVVDKSIKFLKKHKIQMENILRWIPIFLSMDNVYSIYKKGKSDGYSNDKIIDILIMDMKLLLDDNIDKNIKYDDDKDFIDFILNVVKLINDRRKDTGTYKKMMDELIEENNYIKNHSK